MDDVDSLTILKYKLNGGYRFHVMDKFDEEDEAERLDRMIAYSANLAALNGDMYQELWIKTCPVFATR